MALLHNSKTVLAATGIYSQKHSMTRLSLESSKAFVRNFSVVKLQALSQRFIKRIDDRPNYDACIAKFFRASSPISNCMDHQHVKIILRHLTRPTRGGSPAVIIVFAFLLSIAAKAGLAGIPLGLILFSWFFKYAYILFDHTVRGFDEPPVLDIHMLNPLDEQRPLAQLVILGLIYLAVKFVSDTIGSTAAITLAAVVALLLPASVAVLGLEGNILKAAYPVAWIRLVRKLGPMYLLVLAVIGGYFLLIVLLGRWELWFPLEIAIFMFCILSVFSVLGGALYERRHELELETYHSPERTEERLQGQQLRQDEHNLTEAYGQMRAGSHTAAWQLLQTWLTANGNSPQNYHWLCGRVASWGDPRYLTRLTEDYVDRLLTLKRNGEAMGGVAQRLDQDPSFRPKSASAPLQIARLAAAGGTKRVARTLLTDFSTRFPGDPAIAAAGGLARQLSS